MFSNRDLRNLIFPLFVEQFLLMLVGIADTFVVSFSSEADVSGVSLVNSFNTVLIFLFTALSSGGAVMISQYIGSGDHKKAEKSAGQLLMLSAVISALLSAGILLFDDQLLGLLPQGRIGELICGIAALADEELGVAESVFDIEQFFRTHFSYPFSFFRKALRFYYLRRGK